MKPSSAHILRKKPQRTCIACRQGAEKHALLRFVRTSEGRVLFDEGGRAQGRGAYVCASEGCFEKARKSHAFERALRVKMSEKELERLAAQFSNAMEQKMLEER